MKRRKQTTNIINISEEASWLILEPLVTVSRWLSLLRIKTVVQQRECVCEIAASIVDLFPPLLTG